MTTSSYAVSVIPAAFKADYNHICAFLYGDPLTAQNLSQPLVAVNTTTPTTHWYGGQPVDAAWVATFGPGGTLPTPSGGWPLKDEADTVILTEANAALAWAARYINVNTGENAETLPAQNVTTVLAALNLAKPPPPEI